jgi:hypothetical protein
VVSSSFTVVSSSFYLVVEISDACEHDARRVTRTEADGRTARSPTTAERGNCIPGESKRFLWLLNCRPRLSVSCPAEVVYASPLSWDYRILREKTAFQRRVLRLAVKLLATCRQRCWHVRPAIHAAVGAFSSDFSCQHARGGRLVYLKEWRGRILRDGLWWWKFIGCTSGQADCTVHEQPPTASIQ